MGHAHSSPVIEGQGISQGRTSKVKVKGKMQLCHTSTAQYDYGRNPEVRMVRVMVRVIGFQFETQSMKPLYSIEDSFPVVRNVESVLCFG